MTVTNIIPDLEQMRERIRAEIVDALRTPDLSAVREVIGEAGIRKARRALAEAPDRLAEAQAAYREAQAREGLARESYTTALLEAEWELDGRFHTDGNRVYLRLDCEACGGSGAVSSGMTGGEKCEACDGLGTTRKQMTADERKAWKAAEAAKLPAVVVVAAELRRAEEATAAARDALGVADKRLSAAKYDVQAAVAELNALAIGLAAKGA